MRFWAGIKTFFAISLLLFVASVSASQSAVPDGNSALDQYYEQIPFPDGSGPIENGPIGEGAPKSAVDDRIAERLEKKFGPTGSSAAGVALLTDPETALAVSGPQAEGSRDKKNIDSGGNSSGNGFYSAVSNNEPVASSLAPTPSSLFGAGALGLLVIALVLSTLVLTVAAIRIRPGGDDGGRQQ